MRCCLVVKLFVLLAGAGALAGCSALPSSGPLAADVSSQEGVEGSLSGYVLIDIDERIASICASQPKSSLRRAFNDRRPAPDLRIGVGDGVAVTIWEAGAGGLFSASLANLNAGARTAQIPEQVVDRDGSITIPYAGQLKVIGKRPSDVERAIVELLKNKAIEPQAVVTISRNLSNTVTVTGEVTRGAVIPLSVKGDRILDVIAAAGGIGGGSTSAAAYDSFVRLTRNGRTADIPFNTILSSPTENIYVRPNDVITVVRDPQTFTAFGGTGQNASVPFAAVGISLEEAIAKAGGLADSRADPAGIFLMRFEPASLVSQLVPGRELSQGNLIPVIYRLNLRKANSFFLARAFQVKNKDILYVSNAPSDPVEKFLRLVSTITSPIVTGVSVSRSLK